MLAIVIGVLLYTVTGFWIAPRIIASQITGRLPGLTHRSVTVGRVEVNPYRLTLTVSNLFLTEPDGSTFASLGRFHADLEAASLWKRAWILREVEIVRPFLELQRREDGAFNFANLLPSPAPASTPATNTPLPAAILQSLRITEGRIALRDHAIPGGFEKVLTSLGLDFTHLTTRGAAPARGHFQAETSTGEKFRWDGDLALDPLVSTGAIQVGPVTIPRHGPYLGLATPANILGGTVDLELGYSFSWAGPAPDVVVSNLTFSLKGLAVQMPGATATNLFLNDLSGAFLNQ